MIEFNYEIDFELKDEPHLKEWIKSVVVAEGFQLGDIAYVFCTDEYLHKLNVEFLNHDTLTDILSFDYSLGSEVNGEIYISIDRVKENAETFKVTFEHELHRVMVHGALHFCGHQDHSLEESTQMRAKEDYYLEKLN